MLSLNKILLFYWLDRDFGGEIGDEESVDVKEVTDPYDEIEEDEYLSGGVNSRTNVDIDTQN